MIENFKFNKKFGQNFLSDRNLLDAIVSDAQVENEDVLEIGAGAGALTESLVKSAKKVVSYEIDKKLTEHLAEIEKKYSNLKIIMQDALKLPIEEIEKNFEGEYHLVANLPYYITTPLIFKFLEETKRCKTLTVMVQKEVAERFSAWNRSEGYGISSVMLSFYANCSITRNVSKNMFFPRPNVDSAVIRIERKTNLPKIDKQKFKKIVSTSFSMRRKTLVNNLCKNYEKQKILGALEKLNKKENVRAEELTLEDFILLANIL